MWPVLLKRIKRDITKQANNNDPLLTSIAYYLIFAIATRFTSIPIKRRDAKALCAFDSMTIECMKRVPIIVISRCPFQDCCDYRKGVNIYTKLTLS